MVDNTNNYHGVAPDKGTLNGPVLNFQNATYLQQHKGTPNLTAIHFTPADLGSLERRQSSDYWLSQITHGIVSTTWGGETCSNAANNYL
jgi:hypothetical protein